MAPYSVNSNMCQVDTKQGSTMPEYILRSLCRFFFLITHCVYSSPIVSLHFSYIDPPFTNKTFRNQSACKTHLNPTFLLCNLAQFSKPSSAKHFTCWLIHKKGRIVVKKANFSLLVVWKLILHIWSIMSSNSALNLCLSNTAHTSYSAEVQWVEITSHCPTCGF